MLNSPASPNVSPNSNEGFPGWRDADRALIAGIAAYRRHPWRRELADPPAIWSEGDSRLLDFGGDGPPVMFVPSLVNRAHVLDLAPERSMLRWLAGREMRVLLLDWGWPGEVERSFTLTDYVAGRLERALLAAPKGVVLAGYCMGGLLALAAALRRPDRVRALALLATPWDFHAQGAEQPRKLAGIIPMLEPAMTATRSLPIDALQSLFAALEPGGVAAKYRAFARLDQASERARMFVALEDWLNDGVPLAAPVARECLAGWYGENTPGRGVWRIAGWPVVPQALQSLFAALEPGGVAAKYRAFARLDQASERARMFVALEDWLNDGVPLAAPVARECLAGWYGENTPGRGVWRIAGWPVVPQGLDMPSFVAVPGRDRIVPPESALPLAAWIRGAVLHQPTAGHVGMVAGSTAERALWEPLRAWVAGLG